MFIKMILRLAPLLLLLLFASMSVPAEDAPGRERLDARLAAYWDAIRIRDLASAYPMEQGALDGTLTADAFRQRWDRSSWDVLEYQAKDIEIQGNEARLDLTLVLRVPQIAQPLTRTRPERWVFSDGDWYRAPVPKAK